MNILERFESIFNPTKQEALYKIRQAKKENPYVKIVNLIVERKEIKDGRH